MYKLYGALGSPYSMKIRALLRYRRIPHIWVHGLHAQSAQSKVKAPVIPVLEYPDGSFANDSTPLIYDLEEKHSERSVIPADPGQAFLAHLIEDFADEWLTKAMFGYRWLEEVDQIQMSRWLAFDALKGGGDQVESFSSAFRKRQVERMALVGCTRQNFALIEASTKRVLAALEAHAINQHWMFGTRPSLAEFGIYGQLSQLGVDPTAQSMMREEFPYAYRWLYHVDDASGIEGDWAASTLELQPITMALLHEVGRIYVPFLMANAAAVEAGAETFSIEVDGHRYEQGTFKYQLKCLAELRKRFSDLPEQAKGDIMPVLEEAKCLEFLG